MFGKFIYKQVVWNLENMFSKNNATRVIKDTGQFINLYRARSDQEAYCAQQLPRMIQNSTAGAESASREASEPGPRHSSCSSSAQALSSRLRMLRIEINAPVT